MEAKRFLWVSGSSQVTENGDGKSSEKVRMEASQRLRVTLQSSEQGTNLMPGSFETRALARLRSWEPGTDMELRSLRSLRSLRPRSGRRARGLLNPWARSRLTQSTQRARARKAKAKAKAKARKEEVGLRRLSTSPCSSWRSTNRRIRPCSAQSQDQLHRPKSHH